MELRIHIKKKINISVLVMLNRKNNLKKIIFWYKREPIQVNKTQNKKNKNKIAKKILKLFRKDLQMKKSIKLWKIIVLIKINQLQEKLHSQEQ